jgi:hypothetical protein
MWHWQLPLIVRSFLLNPVFEIVKPCARYRGSSLLTTSRIVCGEARGCFSFFAVVPLQPEVCAVSSGIIGLWGLESGIIGL